MGWGARPFFVNFISSLRKTKQPGPSLQGTLQYSSQGNHSFYNSTNNANTFTITSLGNVSCTGSIGCVGVSASDGMRIGYLYILYVVYVLQELLHYPQFLI